MVHRGDFKHSLKNLERDEFTSGCATGDVNDSFGKPTTLCGVSRQSAIDGRVPQQRDLRGFSLGTPAMQMPGNFLVKCLVTAYAVEPKTCWNLDGCLPEGGSAGLLAGSWLLQS